MVQKKMYKKQKQRKLQIEKCNRKEEQITRTNMLIQLVLDTENRNPKNALKETLEPKTQKGHNCFALQTTRKMVIDSLQNGSSNTIGIILALLIILNILMLIKTLTKPNKIK